MNHSIATVVHYCTNDYRFLGKIVEEARLFSQEILIPVCDHFFNGEPENQALLYETYRAFPDCRFIEFVYYPDRLYSPFLTKYSAADREWGFFWHSTSRAIAALFMPPEIEYILFLDSDEVIDGKRFRRYLDTGQYVDFNAARLFCYTYVQRPTLRIQALFTSALFVRQAALDVSRIINVEDRYGIFHHLPSPKLDELFDREGIPFIHHYTWVRTLEECLRKSNTWGHRLDKDWKTEITALFRNPSEARLLTHEVSLHEVAPYFDPLSIQVPLGAVSPALFPHVCKVDLPMVRQKEIERLL